MDKKERIGNVMAFFIVTLALLFDGIQFLISFIPVAGEIISMFLAGVAFLVFWIWFALLGVKYFEGKRAVLKLGVLFGSLIVELIPILDMLPAIVTGVVITIGITRIEDRDLLASATAFLTRRSQRRAISQGKKSTLHIVQSAQPTPAQKEEAIPSSEKIAA